MTARLLHNPRLLTLSVTLIVVAGLAAVTTIRRNEDPRVKNRVCYVLVPFPGASAERVEALVTIPLEDRLRQLADVATVTAVSRQDLAVASVQLDESLKVIDGPVARLREAVNEARLRFPAGAGQPVIDLDRYGGAFSFIVALSWRNEGEAVPAILGRLSRELQSRLRGLAETELVERFGAPREEVEVTLQRGRAASIGLTAQTVAKAIQMADTNRAGGQIHGGTIDIAVETSGALQRIAQVEAVPVSRLPDGTIVRVADVADVRKIAAEPPRSIGRIAGRPAVFVAARMAASGRIDVWSAAVGERLARFRQELPRGVELQTVFDQSRYTHARLRSLVFSLLLGACLVVLVLLVTLGVKSALLVTVSLPLTSLATIAVLGWSGVALDQMSVTGLIVALGLVVDAAIVMVDAIRAGVRAGLPPAAAIARALRRLWLPLLASTLTTILAFMPIILLPGEAGEFIGPVAIAVVVALGCSYLLAMTIVPAAAALLFVQRKQGRASWWQHGLSLCWLTRWFRRALILSLRHPRWSMLIASLPALGGFAASGLLTEQFFPPADRKQLSVEVRLAAGTAIRVTEQAAALADRLIRADPRVTSVHWVIGDNTPEFYYNLLRDQDGVPHFAQAQVTLRSARDVPRVATSLQRQLDGAMPNAQVFVRELLQGPPVAAPLELRLYGVDLAQLRDVGERLRLAMSRVPVVTHTRASLGGGVPAVTLATDADRVALAGLVPTAVVEQIRAWLDGAAGGTLREGSEQLPVHVRAGRRQRNSLGALADTILVGGHGQTAQSEIPLRALVHPQLRPQRQAIYRRDGQRVNIVQGYLRAGVLPQTALDAFEAELRRNPLEMPRGVRLERGGEREQREEAVADLIASAGVLVVLLIAVVVLALDSYRLGLVVLLVALQAAGLGLLSLWLAGYPFGFQTLVALLGLIGVAVNDALIIASTLKGSTAARGADPAAITELLTNDCARHVLSTTLTTFAGFIPLMLSGGGFWPPFATAIAGGVLLSTVISFFFVPAAFAGFGVTEPRPWPGIDAALAAARRVAGSVARRA